MTQKELKAQGSNAIQAFVNDTANTVLEALKDDYNKAKGTKLTIKEFTEKIYAAIAVQS